MNIAINGLGRIGRVTLRRILECEASDPVRKNLNVVAINDLADASQLAHLMKFDSVHGRPGFDVKEEDGSLVIGEEELVIPVYSERDPEELPWRTNEVEMVLESTGVFRGREGASKHIKAGAKKVLISAPGKEDVPSYVLGVNDNELDREDTILSNASCTTNCLGPMIKVLDDNWGVENGFMTTVHAYTADQNLQDGPHKKDMRRARAAAFNIVPTSTGAASAIGQILPHMEGKLDGVAMRVPVPDGSITDLTVTLNELPTVQGVNEVFKDASKGQLKGVLDYSDEELVSSDIVGDPHSCIIDGSQTRMLDRKLKLVGWYDNEVGYSQRLIDLMMKFI